MTGADARIVQLLKEAREALSAERKRRTEPLERWDASAVIDPDPSAPRKFYTTCGAFLGQNTNSKPDFFGISPREDLGTAPQQRPLLDVTLAQSMILPGLPLGRGLAAFALKELGGTPTSRLDGTALAQGENAWHFFGNKYLYGAEYGANFWYRLGRSLADTLLWNISTTDQLVDYLAGAESAEAKPAASTAPSPLPTKGEADVGDLEDEIEERRSRT